MNIKQYIFNIRTRIKNGDKSESTMFEYLYARAYQSGELAVAAFRASLIEKEVAKKYTKGEEIRILINYFTNPTNAKYSTEFNEHETFIENCKLLVDTKLGSYHSILISNISY